MKYTLHACAPLTSTILAAAAAVNVVVILKMNCLLATPRASSVKVPDKLTAEVGNIYTPGRTLRPPRFGCSASVGAIDRALSRN